MIQAIIKLIIILKVLSIATMVVLAVIFWSEIGDFFTGSLDRFDHMISYEEEG